MARGNERRPPRPPLSDGPPSFGPDPPQSTLAAQLVDNVPLPNGQARPQGDGNFEQLLSEILDAGQGTAAEDVSNDADVDVNGRLISVVTRAGLEVLFGDDPFLAIDALLPQATKSLAVIHLTIQRNPAVLLLSINDGHLGRNPSVPPLYVWLLPKLLKLLTLRRAETLHDGIVQLLRTVLTASIESSYEWRDQAEICSYVQACVGALVSGVEEACAVQSSSAHRVSILMPPTAFLAVGLDGSSIGAANVYQLALGDTTDAIVMAVTLLSLLAPDPGLPSPQPVTSRKAHVLIWALDAAAELSRGLQALNAFDTVREKCNDIGTRILQLTRSLTAPILSVPRNPIYAYKVTMSWAAIIATALPWLPDYLDDAGNQSLGLSLIELARACEKSSQTAEMMTETFCPAIMAVCEDASKVLAWTQDLRRIISLLIWKYEEDSHLSPAVQQHLVAPAHGVMALDDKVLDKQLGRLRLINPANDAGRPPKRQRVSCDPYSTTEPDRRKELTRKVYRLLGSQAAADLDGLHIVAADCFAKLSATDQCEAFDALGWLACASASSPVILGEQHGVNETSACRACQFVHDPLSPAARWDDDQSAIAFETMTQLLHAPAFQQSTTSRIYAMMAVRKLVVHGTEPSRLRLADSPLGQWCLQSHYSSLRELRIVAGKTLPAFLRTSLDGETLAQNRRVALEFLRTLSEKNVLGFQETCVLSWGQVARVSIDAELNIVLLRLVEYLGHTNPLVYGVAFNELATLAQTRDLDPKRLLSPFWRSIAITVVRDLQTRPQTVQLLCDLLEITVAQFLVLTQRDTLPYLVLTRKQDVIGKIAQARGRETTVWTMCVENENMAAILALLLVQPAADVEGMAMSLLGHASAKFHEVELVDLARSEPILIAVELLKAAGEEQGTQKAQVFHGIQVLASLAMGKTGPARAPMLRDSTVGAFFEANVLGIIAQFADVINDVRACQPRQEKYRCLCGMEEMMRLAKGHISNALPQICACLQSALGVDALRDQAFATWATMMVSLEAEEIECMIESTFCIVVQKWEELGTLVQQQAAAMVGHLLRRHGDVIKANIGAIPSLAAIPLMAKYEAEIAKLKAQMDVRHHYLAFSHRCQHENVTVVKQAMVELIPYLREHQSFLHTAAVSEQPDPVVADLMRAILDACIRFTALETDLPRLCAECVGLIGCLDPTRVEAVREQPDILVLSNFDSADETVDWVFFLLREFLVKAFMSATNTNAQGFLAFAMQELLKFCDVDATVTHRFQDARASDNYRRWIALPESIRNTLTPFLTSRYVVSVATTRPACSYPIFSAELSHGTWLRTFVTDLLQKGTGDNACMLFPVCSRTIRAQDIAIANFLLPFTALNVIVGGPEEQAEEVGLELLTVLQHNAPGASHAERENLKLCSETVFHVLDYLSRWMQEHKKGAGHPRPALNRDSGRSQPEDGRMVESFKLQRIERVLSCIPAEVISRRAVECKSYARALFHWEQHIRLERNEAQRSAASPKMEQLYARLQHIYEEIDEPDGIEGISAHLHVLHIDQQILEHRKAGRWSAVQSWYEMQLADRPDNVGLQVSLLTCLRESGQHDVMLNRIQSMYQASTPDAKLLPFAVEASWVTGKWKSLEKYLSMCPDPVNADFNLGVAQALVGLCHEEHERFTMTIAQLRRNIAKGLSRAATASLQTCHDDLLKLHVLTDMELIGDPGGDYDDRTVLTRLLDRRLDVLGAFPAEKQFLLGLRRAAMGLSTYVIERARGWKEIDRDRRNDYLRDDVASVWLTSARLARKSNLIQQSFNAVLHASKMGDKAATIEHSRLLWKEGHHRKAIQSLEGAIAVNAFRPYDSARPDDTSASTVGQRDPYQNLLTARAHLLLAKWLDSAGQTQSQGIIHRYQVASRAYLRWEKGHYYLGRHYNKLFESEKARPPEKQAQTFITGETAKLVIQSYLRSLSFGAKYIFQTLPRMLTLWLDLGFEVHSPIDPRFGTGKEFKEALIAARAEQLEQVHSSLRKYIDTLPAYMFYTALAQIVARICHPNKEVLGLLQDIIVKVVSTHPQQALWTLFAVVKSSSKDRAARGATCLTRIKGDNKRHRSSLTVVELKTMITQGQRLSAQLLNVCDGVIQGKPSMVSLSKDLGFLHKSAPCALVVPLEATLTAGLPTIADSTKGHKAFARDSVTISSFLDDVLVLNSLQRPRKISVRGSDGKVYGLLCKPRDDLRKDQRLMEFNAMINRSLKRDAESSTRRLYIKTYAVTPLNEECGLIEWVDNLKTFRDILLKLYKAKGMTPNYTEVRALLDQIDGKPAKSSIFTEQILPRFPAVFHEWFVEMFPEPGSWFTARLKYTRSCAVMSMVGMVLGLGDRHGENVLFEEGNGGTFHVDFNCLFDKGLSFDKPEKVPFRLTHNMVDAFGVYGYEGPYRKSCELTLQILRQNEDTLMTILETFVYDPTTDFIGKKVARADAGSQTGERLSTVQKKTTARVPETPQEVLDSVRGKVKGLMMGESVPLSVEGQVHELIQQAVSPESLSAMYIGWCPFF
ncbi:MAG: serine/threonine-protein kinase M1 [Thelocarpon superellum]|nr:MAG: serine/threonine-protein kinase M1 [Thelocarpon superellum]